MNLEPSAGDHAAAEIQQLQLERLQATVNRVYRNVRFYGRMFEQQPVPEDSPQFDDLRKLPFTTRPTCAPRTLCHVCPALRGGADHTSPGYGAASMVGYTRTTYLWTELTARNPRRRRHEGRRGPGVLRLRPVPALWATMGPRRRHIGDTCLQRRHRHRSR